MQTQTLSKKRRSYYFGLMAEYVAMIWLTLKGYGVLAHRFRSPVGEIDIIAQRGKTMVFIEVKARSTDAEGLFALSPSAQKRIINSVKYFLQKKQWLGAVRCDVIVVKPWAIPYHLKNAFPWSAS